MNSPNTPPRIEIYCDGACSGNPGPGGWAYLIRWNGVEKTGSGGQKNTTNNQMELRAATEALRALSKPCAVTIYADSQYVIKGATEWAAGWQRRGWKNAENKPVANKELWEDLLAALKPHTVRWEWVRGHNGHPENERVDALAVAAVPR